MPIITASGTSRDKANKAYVASPTRPNSTALESVITNTPENPIPTSEVGTPNLIFNEVSGLGVENILLFNFTLPLGVGFVLQEAIFSGDNVATYVIEINNQIKYKIRSNPTNYNPVLNLGKFQIRENDNIKVFVNSITNESASYNITLIFNEFNL